MTSRDWFVLQVAKALDSNGEYDRGYQDYYYVGDILRINKEEGLVIAGNSTKYLKDVIEISSGDVPNEKEKLLRQD